MAFVYATTSKKVIIVHNIAKDEEKEKEEKAAKKKAKAKEKEKNKKGGKVLTLYTTNLSTSLVHTSITLYRFLVLVKKR